MKSQKATKEQIAEFVQAGGTPPNLSEEKKEKEEELVEKKEEDKKEKEEESLPSQEEIKEAYKSFPNAPSLEQIEAWKAEHDNVFTSAFSKKEVMIWRPITRSEYRNIRLLAQQNQESFSQLDYEEITVETCMLWPDPKTDGNFQRIMKKAGVFSTVFEQIQQASHFTPPGAVGLFAAEL